MAPKTLAAGALIAQDEDTLVARLEAVGVDVATLAADSQGTIRGTHHGDLAGGDEDILEGAPEGLVTLGDVLGVGGMGLVRQGNQVALRREVAVKQALRGPDGEAKPSVVHALLREAWISSNLEHPNIVPIHALGTEDGDPLIVMTRITGESWSTTLFQEEEQAACEGGGGAKTLLASARLRRHLQILMRVCHAVHFAHSRGIVHLDLKPSNVMIGAYGEVYLLDWGLGATFAQDAPPWMPRTADIKTVVGTPGYLSPEQAEADGASVGVATDVYLLGAIAHRLVLGRPPHARKSLIASLVSSFEHSPPDYTDRRIPDGLAEILSRAMARKPSDRYESAEALRAALSDLLEHRESADLTVQALARLAQLRESARQQPEGSATQVVTAVQGRRAESECRFGLVEALRIWPGNRAARRALDDLAHHVARVALEVGDWRRAIVALDWLSAPDEELAVAIQTARDKDQAAAAELDQLRALRGHEDLGLNAKIRAAASITVGVGWFVWNLMLGWLHRSETMPLTHEVLMTNVLLTVVVFGAVHLWVRRNIDGTLIDIRVIMLLWAMFLGTALMWGSCWFLGVDPVKTLSLTSAFYIYYSALAVAAIDRSLLGLALGLLPVALGGVAYWEYAFEWHATFGLLAGGGLGFRWLRSV